MAEDQKQFAIELDKEAKVLKAMIFGYYQPNDHDAFVAEYLRLIRDINPEEYEVHFQSRYLRLAIFDMKEVLTAYFELFKKKGFKRYLVDPGPSALLKGEVAKVVEAAGLPNVEFVLFGQEQ
jgi:hypothetical protein